MKHFRMLAAGLCSAVLLCGFAIPAYAYSDGGNEEPPVVEETPAPEPAPTITPGEGFSEDGNLVTREDVYKRQVLPRLGIGKTRRTKTICSLTRKPPRLCG